MTLASEYEQSFSALQADSAQVGSVLAAVLADLGPALDLLCGPEQPLSLVRLATPEDQVTLGTLMVGVGCCEPGEAARLVELLGRFPGSALVVRRHLAQEFGLTALAARRGVTLVGCDADLSWAEVIRCASEALGRRRSDHPSGVARDLFRLADEASVLFKGPVTIEDGESQLIAYSIRQEPADPARLATIAGREVPAHVLREYRSRGVFRRLLTSDQPFVVNALSDSSLPRLVIPIHIAGVWVGSIWVLGTSGELGAQTTQAARLVADIGHSLVRLKLLHHDAGLQMQDALRHALLGEPIPAALSTESAGGPHLGPGPWRVIALTSSVPHEAEDLRYGFILACSRKGWPAPPCIVIDDRVFVVCHDRENEPGSWAWISKTVRDDASLSSLSVYAGSMCADSTEFGRSREEARELADMPGAWRAGKQATTFEEEWVSVLLSRAIRASGLLAADSPVLRLWEHDRLHGTDFVRTLDVWLGHLGDIRRASAILYVHPNTLRQRMKRIQSLVPVDLDDPEQVLAIRLHAQALQHNPADVIQRKVSCWRPQASVS